MKYPIIFGGYGALCLLLAAIFSMSVSDKQLTTLEGKGGVFGPLNVKEKSAVYNIEIRNQVDLFKWSNIEVNVLDAQKNHLFGFSDGLWRESGRDSDGSWEESKTDTSMKLTFKQPGIYYFDVKAERSDDQGYPIYVEVSQSRGSHLPFMILGFLSLLVAVLAYYAGAARLFDPSRKSTLRDGLMGVVLVICFFAAWSGSARGYGYMGYNGYHRGPSFFYLGGPSVYYDRSHRSGSISGPSHRGGGFSGGK